MAYEWQTVEKAAATLGISARTLARRISKREIENRLHNGRREVFICLSDEPVEEESAAIAVDQPTIIDASSNVEVSEQTTAAVSAAAVTATQVAGYDPAVTHALLVAEDRARRAEMAILVIQQSSQLVQHEVSRARTGARWAWATVAVLGVGALVAVAWTTAQVTNARLSNQHLQERAQLAVEESTRLKHDNEQLRDESDQAVQAVARVKGELDEVHREIAQTRADLRTVSDRKAPTTQPSASLARRLVMAVVGD